jgi:glucosamine-6-phosphate deaminase
VIIESSRAAAAARVAEMFADAIQSMPKMTLGLATGGTPVPVYRDWVELHRQSQLSFAGVTTFNLDEYIGLDPAHPQSFRSFMDQRLFRHVDIDASRTFFPDPSIDYDAMIQSAGGIDLQLLGIGNNGHIAFNEPGSAVESKTRLVELSEATREANAKYFDTADQVPRTAISMGIGTILAARQIVLLATGQAKAVAVARAIDGLPSPDCPASFLQHHQAVTFVLDTDAAASLL